MKSNNFTDNLFCCDFCFIFAVVNKKNIKPFLNNSRKPAVCGTIMILTELHCAMKHGEYKKKVGLFTLNTKDFKYIPNLKLFQV